MSNIAKTYTLVNGQPADATQVNKNFDDIIAGVGDAATLRPTIASLGLDADIVTLVLPANTTISAAGAELMNDADAVAQLVTLGTKRITTGSATTNINGVVTVTHGLGTTPSYVGVTNTEYQFSFAVTTRNSTTFTVDCSGSVAVPFSWIAVA